MSNWVDVQLDVLAASPEEINQIERALHEPCDELNAQKDRYWGLVWSHIDFVSADFPKAVFLAQYWDDQMSYGGKVVIHAGGEIRSSRDGDHHAMGCEWAPPTSSRRSMPSMSLVLSAEACGMSGWKAWKRNSRN